MRSRGQILAVQQLLDIAELSDNTIEIGEITEPDAIGGSMTITVSIDCRGVHHAPGGLRLRAREPLRITIPATFPLRHPVVQTPHQRWAGYPHVQWAVQPCLYAAPEVEWQPNDGMHGFIDRLTAWIDRAAAGQLDADGLPVHPPTTSASATAQHSLLISADIGPAAPTITYDTRLAPVDAPAEPTAAVAHLVEGPGGRLDVVGWEQLEDFERRYDSDQALHVDGRPIFGALAILNDREDAFEYPRTVSNLIDSLEARGTPRAVFLVMLARLGVINLLLDYRLGRLTDRRPLVVLVGSPSRTNPHGEGRRQHLVAWELTDTGRRIFDDLGHLNATSYPNLVAAAQTAFASLPDWEASRVDWMVTFEARSEVVRRRDPTSATSSLAGKRVLLLGAGALGAPIAEHILRAGAAALTVVDGGIVTPGILVRQPYADSDISGCKANVLAARLSQLGLGQVTPMVADATEVISIGHTLAGSFDLVIDATASTVVRTALEACWATARAHHPPVITLLVGHDARRGVVMTARTAASGCAVDILRRLALLAFREEREPVLVDVADDLFPVEPNRDMFQPEPGCSSPTFTGSSADLGYLAAGLLLAGLSDLASARAPMCATVIRLPGIDHGAPNLASQSFGWENDWLLRVGADLEVRVSPAARAAMRASARRAARLCEPRTETGGMLLGAEDHAAGVMWIDIATGPPPDSLMSAGRFDHGVAGTHAIVEHHRSRSAKRTTFQGLWHTHPYGPAQPSPTDRASIGAMVSAAPGSPRHALMLIAGGRTDTWEGWLTHGHQPAIFVMRAQSDAGAPTTVTPSLEAVHSGITYRAGALTRPKPAAPVKRWRLIRRWRGR
jgi:integrative and conjugative element protein (TIGR02256 family)